MDTDQAMERLESLRRDLIAFTETRMPAVNRLAAELEESIGDLRRLVDKTKKSEASRKKLDIPAQANEAVVTVGDMDYRINHAFRSAALAVADEVDLDELQSAKLCFDSVDHDQDQNESTISFRAILRFHRGREAVLDSLRLLVAQSVISDGDDDPGIGFQKAVRQVVQGEEATPNAASSYFRKCLDALTEVEGYLEKNTAHKMTVALTGLHEQGQQAQFLDSQRNLLMRQHEYLAAILSLLMRANYASHIDFRPLLTKASQQERLDDVAIHYIPMLTSGAARFGADEATGADAAKEIHALFAPGPSRLQWKQGLLRAAATVFWLAEYNSRFLDPASAQTLRVADRQKEEQDRLTLFLDCVKDKAFHFMLIACQYLKPEIWHDPAKVGLVRFLLDDTPPIPFASSASHFATLAMSELQSFSDAFVANMPDALRWLKVEEDERRRANFSRAPDPGQHDQLDLERFLLIMSYAYQDDADAAQDFWADKEGNLYGFLRWASQRLPTPRVAAFCELLRAIATDKKTGDQAHLFLSEDSTMTGGRLRKSFSISWSQIFSELELYATTIKDKPASAQQISDQNGAVQEGSYNEPETYIMLESYIRLAAHLCRVSPDARNWVLREQNVHIGETLFLLASTGNDSRIHAVCFDMLASLLTDKAEEVNEGMWALLDNWISGGGASLPRHGRLAHPEQKYLHNYVANPETAAGLVNLLNALITPTRSSDELALGSLPFPEGLGAQSRHGGIEIYVDFVMGPIFRSTSSEEVMALDRDHTSIDVLRCACLQFVCICLSTFQEELVTLANATNLNVDAAIRCSTLSAYVRLHPFARVMDWMLNNNAINALTSTIRQDVDFLNEEESPDSPRVQATLKAVQAVNLAMRLQATYFDIVRPLIGKNPQARSISNANPALSSYDEVILSQLDTVVDIVSFTASKSLELSLESLALLDRIVKSRKLSDPPAFSEGSSVRIGGRLVGRLSGAADAIATNLVPYFVLDDTDLDSQTQPAKLMQANAILKALKSSLYNASGRPTIAHCLLGFSCSVRTLEVAPGSAFATGKSLFHHIVTCAVQTPSMIDVNNMSWLLQLKMSCMDVVLNLARSPLTRDLVVPNVRSMDFFLAMAEQQVLAPPTTLWDGKSLDDIDLLFDSSAVAVKDFLRLREAFFDYAALELRDVCQSAAYSVQEKVLRALLGTVNGYDRQEIAVSNVIDLFDFFDLETQDPLVAHCRLLDNLDFSSCVKFDEEIGTTYDITMVERLLLLRKRELQINGTIKDVAEGDQVDDEIRATCASLSSQNNWHAIQIARISALESWVDLLSLMTTCDGLNKEDTMAASLQGLQVAIPRLERSLSESIDSAALLAKLCLTLVQAVTSSSSNSKPSQSTGLVHERLISTFRACLKVITDSNTGLGLRDVCYRICCAVLAALPLTVTNGKIAPSSNARQLLQLVQSTGGRLTTVITEDAFSGRGITRVSSLLFLDALTTLFQLSKVDISMLRALEKLNFIPVLIDQSIGSVTSSFSGDNVELSTTVAYFHTALSLLLRICQTAEGAQLILNSGFFAAVTESRLFSTDPDIGLDIDNPVALREFYKLLSAVLRVVTALVLTRGAGNASVLQQAKSFLHENRFSMQAVFKRTSAVQKTAGPPEKEAVEVAEEFSRVLVVTGFLEDDEPAHIRAAKVDGFT